MPGSLSDECFRHRCKYVQKIAWWTSLTYVPNEIHNNKTFFSFVRKNYHNVTFVLTFVLFLSLVLSPEREKTSRVSEVVVSVSLFLRALDLRYRTSGLDVNHKMSLSLWTLLSVQWFGESRSLRSGDFISSPRCV